MIDQHKGTFYAVWSSHCDLAATWWGMCTVMSLYFIFFSLPVNIKRLHFVTWWSVFSCQLTNGKIILPLILLIHVNLMCPLNQPTASSLESFRFFKYLAIGLELGWIGHSGKNSCDIIRFLNRMCFYSLDQGYCTPHYRSLWEKSCHRCIISPLSSIV